MKGLLRTAGAALLFAVAVLTATAQSGQKAPMMRHYDPKTEVTFTGTVESVDQMGYANMRGNGIHLTVKSANETTDVHLGPAALVEGKMTFKKGDTIEVIGSKVTMMGKTAVIARQIKKGDQVLTLRDEKGVPVWARRGGKPVS